MHSRWYSKKREVVSALGSLKWLSYSALWTAAWAYLLAGGYCQSYCWRVESHHIGPFAWSVPSHSWFWVASFPSQRKEQHHAPICRQARVWTASAVAERDIFHSFGRPAGWLPAGTCTSSVATPPNSGSPSSVLGSGRSLTGSGGSSTAAGYS